MTRLGSLRRWSAAVLVPLAAAGALVLGPRVGEAQGRSDIAEHRALFPVCAGGPRVTCVVDGDTIWLAGAKIRIADIDTPEVSRPSCPREAALGRRATERLRQLLNAGPFTLHPPPGGRLRDRYGRELRLVQRGGESLGEVLVKEGLAVRWGGPRARWCGAEGGVRGV
ncbi:thermonuclease family protein [Erythrobacter sp. NE805]|uniref:thermonuclease family protein n=1 Tax=Erythrobacter sp. NE805 TaxID=3389875 RepID=UPI00396B1E64